MTCVNRTINKIQNKTFCTKTVYIYRIPDIDGIFVGDPERERRKEKVTSAG